MNEKIRDCLDAAIESLLDLDEMLKTLPENDSKKARQALIPAFARVAELSRVLRVGVNER